MDASNPYAPPQATVRDITDPSAPFALAERATRLGAAILDGLILGAMVYLPLTLAFVTLQSGSQPSGLSYVPLIVGFIGCVAWIWLTTLYVSRNGQTIGKKIVAIKVVRTDGSPASLGRIFWLRNVVNLLISALSLVPILAIVSLYGLADVLFIFSERRRTLHDRIADTIVVKA